MADIETRPGVRPAWNTEQETTYMPTETNADDKATVDPIVGAVPAAATSGERPGFSAETGVRRPMKLLAELSRAMQTAAEASRDETMARFTAEAKIVVEDIQGGSTAGAADLRRLADDDVAAIREWSKGEIARIREETDNRIARRKTALDREMEAHATLVQERVDRIGTVVTEFEARMTVFFDRLRAEEDPTRIATMAETMPEPPDLGAVAASIPSPTTTPFESAARPDVSETVVPAPDADTTDAPVDGSSVVDFAAAEAEALVFDGEAGDEDDDEAETASAAAEASAETDHGQNTGPDQHPVERHTTEVTVLGLVSVASIATFKRGLGRVAGVSTIGVASGPDGEFLFTVAHAPGAELAKAITAMPGFGARVSTQSAGTLQIVARDPDVGA
ncbi:MAG: hypothetical protein H0T59_06295 [Chloroflexi bacterium]|nr:hypothetical protein [Chloroflexota bacterium]